MANETSSQSIEYLRAVLPAFCREHGIQRVELFGSLAKGQQGPASDIDLPVTFRPNVKPGIEFFGLEEELKSLLGVNVDVLTCRSVEASRNPIRRRSVLESARDIYAE
ncbi:MAG: polymerase beta domain protein region [Bryobacterales bacterium]|jgi:predicted nucleotidyltransferase|nr:polymerase beta domain protein region [Bryobacterales bacterium]